METLDLVMVVLCAALAYATLRAWRRADRFDVRPMARSLLIDSVQDAMMVVDDARCIIDCNRMATELLGETRRGLLGRPAADVLPREFAALLQSTVHLRSELAAGIGGESGWFEVDVTPLRLLGRRAGHLIMARDISERHEVRAALEESRRALESANAQLIEQSITDPLTGLKNRRFLFQRLHEEISRHRRSGAVLGLLVLDLDHFKSINDTHGHPAGDDALIRVAAALSATVRDCDVVARLGGEEFAIVAVNTEPDGLLKLAERLRAAVGRTPVARDTDRPMALTASIGVAIAGNGGDWTADGLFGEADRYLYEAKRGGRDRVVSASERQSGTGAGRG